MKINPNIYKYNQIKESEAKTFKKINSYKVMQRAAKASFEYIINNLKFKKILVICGPGNNGGDGILIANFFQKRKKNINIFSPLGLGKTNDAKKALESLNDNELIEENINIDEYDLIIDCLFGIGLNQPLSSKIYFLINKINNLQAKIVSIDMPSGVYTDTGEVGSIAIKANITLTFHRLKPGLLLLPGKEYSGKIEILDIQLEEVDKDTNIKVLVPPALKKNKISDHKYNRGTTYIIAGKKLIGASKLAVMAASQASLRVGSGVSKIFVKKSDENFFKPHVLEEMIIPYNDLNHLIEIINKTNISSLVYGCGIEVLKTNGELLDFLLQQPFKIVLDASAFSLIKTNKNFFFKLLSTRTSDTILTPHKGEFQKLFNCTKDKLNDCLEASKQINSVIVYKGNDTVIASPNGEIYLNYNNSPFLATAGSGDVLAGMIGSFLAQQYTILDAAKIACYIHSQCGINLNRGLIASDLVKEIPRVLNSL